MEDEQRIKAEEERIRAEEEATKAAEIARWKVEEEARLQLEKERSRIEEEAKKAAEMARLKVEEEAKIRADEARVAAQKLADEVAQRAADAVLNPKLELPKLELDFPEFELNLPKLELDLPDIGDFEITDSVKLGVSGVLIAGVAAAVASQAGNDDKSYGNEDGIVREWKDDNTQPYGLRDNEGMNSSPRSLKGMSDMPKSSGPQSTKSSFGPGQSGGSPGMKMKSSSPFGAPSGGMGMKGNTSTMPKSPMQQQSFGAAGSSPAYKQGSSPFGAPAGSMGKTSTMSMNKGDSGGLGMKGKSSSMPMNKQGSSTFGAPSGSMGKTSTMTMNKGVGGGLGLKGSVPSGGIGKTTMPMSKGFGGKWIAHSLFCYFCIIHLYASIIIAYSLIQLPILGLVRKNNHSQWKEKTRRHLQETSPLNLFQVRPQCRNNRLSHRGELGKVWEARLHLETVAVVV